MKNLVQLEAELFLAKLAFAKNPIEAYQEKIDAILAQIAEQSEIAPTSDETIQNQTKKEKKKEVAPKAPAKPKTTTPKAPAKSKASKAPVTPEVPNNTEELTNSSKSSEESTAKPLAEVTDSQTLQEPNDPKS